MVATLEKWGASCENDIYVGDEEGRYLDSSGWIPGKDYVITEEQSASAEEILATIEVLTENSSSITSESRGVEEGADIVAKSSDII